FGKEIGPKSSNNVDEGITFDYQHFKILILDGAHVRLALILDTVPTETLRINGKAFLGYFESMYDVANWKGNLDIFTNVDNVIEQAFEITLVYPLVVNKDKDAKGLKSKLGRALHEVGMAVQEEKNVFYLATLVNYAKAGRKESEDHVLAEIYNLKKDGYFTFFSPDS
nr:hypothetical protein [Candidatus Sigynarchaeota archaeon]